MHSHLSKGLCSPHLQSLLFVLTGLGFQTYSKDWRSSMKLRKAKHEIVRFLLLNPAARCSYVGMAVTLLGHGLQGRTLPSSSAVV